MRDQKKKRGRALRVWRQRRLCHCLEVKKEKETKMMFSHDGESITNPPGLLQRHKVLWKQALHDSAEEPWARSFVLTQNVSERKRDPGYKKQNDDTMTHTRSTIYISNVLMLVCVSPWTFPSLVFYCKCIQEQSVYVDIFPLFSRSSRQSFSEWSYKCISKTVWVQRDDEIKAQFWYLHIRSV